MCLSMRYKLFFNLLLIFLFRNLYKCLVCVLGRSLVIIVLGFRSLGEGEAVEVTVRLGDKGLEAENVKGIGGAEIKGHVIRPLKNKDTLIRYLTNFRN